MARSGHWLDPVQTLAVADGSKLDGLGSIHDVLTTHLESAQRVLAQHHADALKFVADQRPRCDTCDAVVTLHRAPAAKSQGTERSEADENTDLKLEDFVAECSHTLVGTHASSRVVSQQPMQPKLRESASWFEKRPNPLLLIECSDAVPGEEDIDNDVASVVGKKIKKTRIEFPARSSSGLLAPTVTELLSPDSARKSASRTSTLGKFGLISNCDDVQWQWWHRKGYRDYDVKSNARIEKAYQNGESKVSVKSGKDGCRPYIIFFSEMKQFDPVTKNIRTVLRVGRDKLVDKINRSYFRFVNFIEDHRHHTRTSRIATLEEYKQRQEELAIQKNGMALPMSDGAEIPTHDSSMDGHTTPTESGCYALCRSIKKDSWFEVVAMFAVLCNSVWIAIETDCNDAPTLVTAPIGFQIMEYLFCTIFTIELAIRFFALRIRSSCFNDPWFRLDFVLVTIMTLETWALPFVFLVADIDQSKASGLSNLSVLRLARLIRLTRMARLVRWIPEIMTLLKGILDSVRSVLFAYCLLGILLYVFGIVFKTINDHSDKLDALKYFTSVTRSMWTLMLHGLFLDDISGVLNAMHDAAGGFVCFIFLIFVLLGHFTVLNMVIGFQCEVASSVSQKDKADAEEHYLRSNLLSIMECYDKDESQFLEKREFQLLLHDPDVHHILMRFGTDPVDLEHMADVIFQDRQHEAAAEMATSSSSLEHDLEDVSVLRSLSVSQARLSFKEFLDLAMRLQGSHTSRVTDVVDLREYMRQLLDRRLGSPEKV